MSVSNSKELLKYMSEMIRHYREFQYSTTNVNENVSILEIRFGDGCYMHITNKTLQEKFRKIILENKS